jgi:hypothetical protein
MPDESDRPVRVIALFFALTAWFLYIGHKNKWVELGGILVIFGIAELISHYMKRKKQ